MRDVRAGELRGDDRGLIAITISPIVIGIVLGLLVLLVSFFVAPELFGIFLLVGMGVMTLGVIVQAPTKAAIVAVVVVFLVVSSVVFFFILAPLEFDTNTIEREAAGWRGSGSWNLQQNGEGEMIAPDNIITAIDASKDSEPIFISARYKDVGLFECLQETLRYEVNINIGTGWTRIVTKNYPPNSGISLGGWFDRPLDDPVILRGIYPHGSYIQAKFRLKCLFGEWVTLATDHVRLVSGEGDVDWGKDRYEVSESACVVWRVPWVASEIDGRGWFIHAWHVGTGEEVIPSTEIKTQTGKLCFTVSSSHFQSGGGTCRNEIKALLTSELYLPLAWDATTTIDISEKGPKVLDLLPERAEYEEGETIVITWTVEEGALGRPIDVVKMSVGDEEIQEFELETDAETFEYTTSKTGATRTLKFSLFIQDDACRPDLSDVDVIVHKEGEITVTAEAGIPIFFILALILMGLVPVLVVFLPLPGPKAAWVIGSFIAMAVVVVVVIQAGAAVPWIAPAGGMVLVRKLSDANTHRGKER